MQANGTVMSQSPENAIEKFEGMGFLDDFSDDGEDISDGGSRDDSPDRHYEPPKPSPKASTSLRQMGDMAIYKYYLKSVKPGVFSLWLLVLCLISVSEKAPGMNIPNLRNLTVLTRIH